MPITYWAYFVHTFLKTFTFQTNCHETVNLLIFLTADRSALTHLPFPTSLVVVTEPRPCTAQRPLRLCFGRQYIKRTHATRCFLELCHVTTLTVHLWLSFSWSILSKVCQFDRQLLLFQILSLISILLVSGTVNLLPSILSWFSLFNSFPLNFLEWIVTSLILQPILFVSVSCRTINFSPHSWIGYTTPLVTETRLGRQVQLLPLFFLAFLDSVLHCFLLGGGVFQKSVYSSDIMFHFQMKSGFLVKLLELMSTVI